MAKRVYVESIEDCMNCPHVVSTGREDEWCNLTHSIVVVYNEEDDEDTCPIPDNCPLEESHEG